MAIEPSPAEASKHGDDGADESYTGDDDWLGTGDVCGDCGASAGVATAGSGELAGAGVTPFRELQDLRLACPEVSVSPGFAVVAILRGLFCAGFKPRCGPLKSGQLSCTVPPSACCGGHMGGVKDGGSHAGQGGSQNASAPKM